MEEALSAEKIERFDFFIRSLNTAIKNSVLYFSAHPVFDLAIKNLKASIENWFVHEDKLEIGFTQDNLLLGDSYVRGKSEAYEEVADYLHNRGVLALSINKGIEVGELVDFVVTVKDNAQLLREKGGVIESMPPTPHLKIKEVDYTDLLISATEEVSDKKWDIWPYLCDFAEGSIKGGGAGGKLPQMKMEFLEEFLKNPSSSANLLNNVYRQAKVKGDEKSAVKDIKGTISAIINYFEKEHGGDSKEARKEIADILAKMGPGLVVKILEEGGEGEEGGRQQDFDLARELTKDFSDEMIGEFMSSMIANEGTVNENLFKVLNKIVSDKEDVNNLASKVTDNIYYKNMDMETLKKLQISMRELAKAHPVNKFMTQMYKMTLDTFVSSSADAAVTRKKMAGIIKDFEEGMQGENIKKEQLRLLLNILWHEEDPEDFKKLVERINEYFPRNIREEDVRSIRDLLEFFVRKLRPEQKDDERLAPVIDRALGLVNNQNTVVNLISLVPDASDTTIRNILYILAHVKPEFRGLLIDAFILEENPLRKDGYLQLMFHMGKTISHEISERITEEKFSVTKDLLNILRVIDPECSRSVTKDLFKSKDPKIRLEALQGYIPSTMEDREIIFEKFMRERQEKVKELSLNILVKTKDWGTIDRLFKVTEKNFFSRKYLVSLVKSCGENKIVEAVPHLEKILFRRYLFNTSGKDNLRIAAAVSLGRIGTQDSMDIVKRGLEIKREPVKRMCEIVLRLEEHGREKGPDKREG